MVEIRGKIIRVKKEYYYLRPQWRLDIAVSVLGLKPVVGRIKIDTPIMKKLLEQDPTAQRIEQLKGQLNKIEAVESKRVIQDEIARLERLRATGKSIEGMQVHLYIEPTADMPSLEISPEIKEALKSMQRNKIKRVA